MATQLDPAVAAEMDRQAKAIKDRQTSGTFTKNWALGGKNAIVAEGGEVITRLCPRWDYSNSMIKDPATQKWVKNPDYKTGQAFWVMAFEHWWENAEGKKTSAWCLRSLNVSAACPICEASERLRNAPNQDDRKFGKDISARDVYIFNAVIGKPRRVDDKKKADIRTIKFPATAFNKLRDIMRGGEESSKDFALGDVSHPLEGHDLKLIRPAKGGQGTQWNCVAAPQASRLFESDQADAFKGWPSFLINLEEMLEKEVKSYLDLFKAYHGRDPEPGEVSDAGEQPAGESPQATQAITEATESAPAPESPDDEFPMMPGPAAPAPQASRPAAPATPARPSARPSTRR